MLQFCCSKRSLFCSHHPSITRSEPESEANVQLLQLLRRHLTVNSRPQSGQSTSSDFLQFFSKHLAVIGFPHSLHNVSWAFLYLLELKDPCSCCLRRLPPEFSLEFPPFCFIIFNDLLPTDCWLVDAEIMRTLESQSSH